MKTRNQRDVWVASSLGVPARSTAARGEGLRRGLVGAAAGRILPEFQDRPVLSNLEEVARKQHSLACGLAVDPYRMARFWLQHISVLPAEERGVVWRHRRLVCNMNLDIRCGADPESIPSQSLRRAAAKSRQVNDDGNRCLALLRFQTHHVALSRAVVVYPQRVRLDCSNEVSRVGTGDAAWLSGTTGRTGRSRRPRFPG